VAIVSAEAVGAYTEIISANKIPRIAFVSFFYIRGSSIIFGFNDGCLNHAPSLTGTTRPGGCCLIFMQGDDSINLPAMNLIARGNQPERAEPSTLSAANDVVKPILDMIKPLVDYDGQETAGNHEGVRRLAEIRKVRVSDLQEEFRPQPS
jgi:hypothetical protein